MAAIDDELMRVLAEGERPARERACRELVRRYAAKLTGWTSTLLRDPSQVDDVVQDTFVAVFEARERYQPGGAAFSTWLYRIARNRALDVIRSHARRGAERLASDAAPVDAAPAPSAALSAAEDAERLRAAVQELPLPDREALLLRYDESLGYEEIARLTESSAAAVKQRVFRARRRLRQLLEDGSEG